MKYQKNAQDIGFLISFKLNVKLEKKARAKFFRDFYGYQDKSQFGRYFYERAGFLRTAVIPYIKLNRAVMIVRPEDKNRVVSYLKKWGSVATREVILSKRDKQQLFLNAKEV